MIEKLAIAEAVRAKATMIPAGFAAEKLLTGDADLAVQQLSELIVVPWIEIVGKFPEHVQQVTSLSAAIMSDAEKAFRATTPPAASIVNTTNFAISSVLAAVTTRSSPPASAALAPPKAPRSRSRSFSQPKKFPLVASSKLGAKADRTVRGAGE
jgi:hypothetical protein